MLSGQIFQSSTDQMPKLPHTILLTRLFEVNNSAIFFFNFYVIQIIFRFVSTAIERYHRVLCLGNDYSNPNHPLNVLNEAWK